MYINTHTYYSLRYGTLTPKELVQQAKAFGYQSLVLTDINNTSCAVEFYKLCIENKIKPILGIEFRQKNRLLYIGIAKNRVGWTNLNKFLSDHSIDKEPLPEIPPFMENVIIIYPRLIKAIELFKAHEFLGIQPQFVNRIFSSPIKKYMHKLLAWNPVVYKGVDDWLTHKLLRCIDLNILSSQLTPKDCATSLSYMVSKKELKKRYELYPQLLENVCDILEKCSIELVLDFKVNRLNFTGSKKGDFELLKKLAIGGYDQRYGTDTAALERIEKELKVILKQDFCAYFLIAWDVIRYAQTMGYHHVGRGSGANSIVAFCLHITDVDPMDLDLYFERFINPYRTSPPDFDIDFSWDERDIVTDYIFKRYGRGYTALLATYNTFKGKSTIRELGKVFGLPKSEIDLIIKHPNEKEKHHEFAPMLYKYGKRLETFPNYLSIHAGGILISERPLYEHTALQMMPKGFPITHFDMYHAEALKFHKFDILSQRGLGHIKDCITLVKQNQGKAIDIHNVQKIKEDQRVKDQLRAGKCIGCFYIESPAMRGLLSKLKCDNYIHLVAASSIIRPGVAKSGMMREYIHRFHHPNSFDYPHPIFEAQLKETFGVMVYQEDVMKIVHHFAGLDLDESDVLRRIMSGKKYRNDTFEYLKKKYFDNCKERGYSIELSTEVWRQIESFSGYSFSKAHSASYAVESFQSLYLKTYYPLEFMVAVINNFGGFYHTEYYFHEARMLGAEIHAPCVNHSEYLTSIEGKDIYIGYVHLHEMERKVAIRIAKERKKYGAFNSLADFVNRVAISSEQLEILIRIGAFRFTTLNKYELMWEKNAVFNPQTRFELTGTLFEHTEEKWVLPDLEEGDHDQIFDEIELLGFIVKNPFHLLSNQDNKTHVAANLKTIEGQYIEIIGYYICQKNVRTSTGKWMYFGTWFDIEGNYFDTTHFPNSVNQFPFRGKGIYKLSGRVVSEFGFYSIEVNKMFRLGYVKDGRY